MKSTFKNYGEQEDKSMLVLSRSCVKNRARKYLEQQLELLRPGEQLPPVRMLMQDAGVGRIRIDSLFAEFESLGRITRAPGKGIFKAGETGAECMVPYIDLVSCGLGDCLRPEVSSTFSELVMLFSSEVARTHQGVRLHEIPVGEPRSSYEKIFRRSDVKACVLIGLHSPNIVELFEKHKIAWVALFPNSLYNITRAILPSDEVVKLQLDHLWSLGHHRIAFLYTMNEQMPSRAITLRRESFYRLMAERGFRVDPNWVCRCESYKDGDIECACQKIFAAEVVPTAIIVPDPVLPAVYRFCERKGLEIGKDISIVATDDLSVARQVSPSATSVHMPLEVIIQKTLETLADVVKGKDVLNTYHLPAKLIVRESTGSACS